MACPEPGQALWRKQRTLSLRGAPDPQALRSVPGVLAFRPDSGACWIVVYDVRVIQFAAIAAALANICPDDWLWRMRVRWRQFQDVNIRDNLLAKDGACCNRPPRKR